MLTKFAAWVHTPYERVCHKIVFKFYSGNLTTSDSLDAAEKIARQIGVVIPESAQGVARQRIDAS
jgi:hypothetical protein